MNKKGLLTVGVGACCAVAALYTFDPAVVSFFPPCFWKQATGWDCPGCGSTRAAHQMLHGEAAAAFRFNPLLVVGLPIVGVTWAWGRFVAPPLGVDEWRRRRRRQAGLLIVVGLAFAVWRNSSYYPFNG